MLIWLNLLLALFSKENAIVVIPVLLLIEALWFQFKDHAGETIRWLQRLTLSSMARGGVGLLAMFFAYYDHLVAGFRHRPFTLGERLLTQSRIMWDYVGQLVTPDVTRMGLYHDDVLISHSLSDPVSTGYSVGAWVVALALFLLLLRWAWGRWLALGLSWFIIGHSVESTVIPLELYFEHRNYFPGIGLFLSLGTLYMLLVRRWRELSAPLLVYLGALVIWLASLTGSQVQVWSSHPLLILSHLNGHPASFRANADMAVQMANLGQIEEARKYSSLAHASSASERSGDMGIRDLALTCIANKAAAPGQISALGSATPQRPFSSVTTMLTMVRLLQEDACPVIDREAFAERMAQIYLEPGSVATASSNVYHALAVLENSLQRWDYANAYIDRVLERHPNQVRGLLMKLHFTTALGLTSEADIVRARLSELDKNGKLTVGQQQTLSLYLEI